tara:strand:+ start:2128 stop:3042 length:915 start_codon:yes stop_codon:yes gene_type:complete
MEENYKFNFKNLSELNLNDIPDEAGIYAFRLIDENSLPAPFNQFISSKGNNFFYIGQASKSILERMYHQELNGKKHGTFFRSLGAVLGFLPPKGSLVNRDTRNYKFSKEDSEKIIKWISDNLEIAYFLCSENIDNIESELIANYKPLLNIKGNPDALPELSKLRSNCVEHAKQDEREVNNEDIMKFDIKVIKDLFNGKDKVRVSFAVDEMQFENAGFDPDQARFYFEVSNNGELIDWDNNSLEAKVLPSHWHEFKEIGEGYICYPFINNDGWNDEEYITDICEIDDAESIYHLCNEVLLYVKNK